MEREREKVALRRALRKRFRVFFFLSNGRIVFFFFTNGFGHPMLSYCVPKTSFHHPKKTQKTKENVNKQCAVHVKIFYFYLTFKRQEKICQNNYRKR